MARSWKLDKKRIVGSMFDGQVLRLLDQIYEDDRGYFMEGHRDSFNLPKFVQDNFSHSKKGVFRGLHTQIYPNPVGKLVRVIQGTIVDFFVDLRSGPTFGYIGVECLNDIRDSLYIPQGFAHGFLALEDSIVHYKQTDYHDPDSELIVNIEEFELNDDRCGLLHNIYMMVHCRTHKKFDSYGVKLESWEDVIRSDKDYKSLNLDEIDSVNFVFSEADFEDSNIR